MLRATRPLPRLAAALSALAATAATTVALGATLATSADAAPSAYYHRCGYVDMFVAVSEHHASCSHARTVARAALKHRRPPYGFHCHQIAVDAGSGYYYRCRHHDQRVTVVPE